jgi:hypothetical protein
VARFSFLFRFFWGEFSQFGVKSFWKWGVREVHNVLLQKSLDAKEE